jgi:predicted Zn finger-like uncharacterized protein
MRFRCDNCDAQYAIADEKLGKKGVRIRCKKCSEIITVRPLEKGETKQSGFNGLDLGQDEELKNAMNSVLQDEFDADDMDHQSTRVFSADEMQQVQAEREQAGVKKEKIPALPLSSQEEPTEVMESPFNPPEEPSSSTADQGLESSEWYAVVDGQQVGPMTKSEFGEKYQEGEFDADTLIWKNGFSDWMPVFEVREFEFLAEDEGEAYESDWDANVGESILTSNGDDYLASGALGSEEDAADPEDEEEAEAAFDDQEATELHVGADVDWKPSALSALDSLAVEELQCLQPVDEQNLTDSKAELAEPATTEQGEEAEDSLIAQMAEEETVALREQEKLAEQQRQEEKLRVDHAAKTAARELAEQQPDRLPHGQYLPPKTVMPRWLWALVAGGSVLLIAAIGIGGYALWKLSESESVRTHPRVTDNVSPPVAHTTRVDIPDQEKPKDSDASAIPSVQKQQKSTTSDGAAVAFVQPVKDTKKGSQAKRERKSPRRRNEPKVKPGARKARTKTVEKKPSRAQAKRTPSPAKSAKGLLDFEDPDDRAFARETGRKTKPVKSVVPQKKELAPLSNSDVMGVMKQHMAEFKACNRKQKERDPSVRGRMVVNFTIGTNGRVSKTGLSAKTKQFESSFVSGCIQNIIKRLRFPPFGGPKKTVPFPFTVN